ncbi:DUF2264 domain-containing protein [Streptomyces sp. NRRL S-1521]|uniref:DUF2264 domain-containing protein n=1 Tax=Streptomyces sp. NRRL S-1521 TaxID=1609100 RepID=UPI002D218B25|nr:DUF2264 domain-containing protein [Streptomyces sp. NRRL S-1521]
MDAPADRLLTALGTHRSPHGVRLLLPGPNSSADPGGPLERCATGLAADTDPPSPEAWPRPDRLHQVKVEAASIALILQWTKPWLCEGLDPHRVREDTVLTARGAP